MKKCALLLLLTGIAIADIAVPVEARRSLHLTVYNHFGLIKDTRRVNIPQGENRIRFEGVATAIQPSSVLFDVPDSAAIEMIGQSYEFDLVKPSKLLEKYVGKELEIVPRRGSWPDSSIQSAELISVDGEEPVFRIGTKITFGQIGQIMFPYMPDNLYFRPTVLWDVISPKRQELLISVSYVTKKIHWDVGYLVYMDTKGQTGSIRGWVELDNQTGINFKDAHVSFVAGDVRMADSTLAPRSSGARDFNYYTINRPVTLNDHQAKQFEWIPKTQIKLKELFYVQFNQLGKVDKRSQEAVYSALEISNVENNGLGIPLPAGIVRVFKKDTQDNSWFTGEDMIDDIAPGQAAIIRTGKTTGVSVVRHSELRKSSNQVREELCQIELTNLKDSDIIIKLRDNVHGAKLLHSSESYRIVSSSFAEWDVVVRAKSSTRLSYTLQQNDGI